MQKNNDYTTNSHCLTYIFLFERFGRMYFLNLGVKGLVKGCFVRVGELPVTWEKMKVTRTGKTRHIVAASRWDKPPVIFLSQNSLINPSPLPVVIKLFSRAWIPFSVDPSTGELMHGGEIICTTICYQAEPLFF